MNAFIRGLLSAFGFRFKTKTFDLRGLYIQNDEEAVKKDWFVATGINGQGQNDRQ